MLYQTIRFGQHWLGNKLGFGRLVAGKTVLKAMKTQVPDKDGNMGKYKKADFKYDVAAGFITF